MTDVTVITANFKTPDLVARCIFSLHEHYSGIRHIVIDNGGCARSLEVLRGIEYIDLVENGKNVGHGPALHQGIEMTETRYVFTLDSDTKVVKGGFLGEMELRFVGDDELFAIGWLRYTNESGVASPRQELKRGMEYVHPYACMLDREKYFELHPFIHSGAPATHLMASAVRAGYHLESFPIEDYIEHKIAGTRGMFRGRCNVGTDEKPGRWRMHRI